MPRTLLRPPSERHPQFIKVYKQLHYLIHVKLSYNKYNAISASNDIMSAWRFIVGLNHMHDIKTVKVMDSSMEIFLFSPEEPGPHAAIILAQHIPIGHTGIENDTFTLDAAQRFAHQGFFVAVPFIFHWWPKDDDIQIKRSQSRDDWMVADIKASYDYLTEMDSVTDKIGIVGHCWGGRVAWLGACHIPQLSGCAMFYAGRIKLAMGEGNPPAIELAGNIKCPVAGYFGNDDQTPSPKDVDDYAAALETAGVPHSFHRYDGAGHAFQNFPNKERYREKQSEDAWEKVMVFMKENLRQESA